MEQDLTKLHSKLEKYMKEHIISSDLQKKISFQFVRLQKFMQDSSIEFYNENVGIKYLKFRELPGNSRMKENCAFRIDSRYVDM